MISTVIFDMDGLLLSTEPVYFECYQKAAAQEGLDFSYELFEACVGLSGEESRRVIHRHFDGKCDVSRLIRRTYAQFEKYLADGGEIDFRPGAKEAVEYFYNRGFKTGVASSNLLKWVEYLLKRKGIYGYFSSVLASDHVSKPKPDPEIYLRSARALNAAPEQCLAFEDSAAGATAAITAGLRTCVVPQIKQPDTFVRQNAFRVYHSLRDIYPDMDELLS